MAQQYFCSRLQKTLRQELRQLHFLEMHFWRIAWVTGLGAKP
jgi:hypothetical protein